VGQREKNTRAVINFYLAGKWNGKIFLMGKKFKKILENSKIVFN
jgi:hypothetical protein